MSKSVKFENCTQNPEGCLDVSCQEVKTKMKSVHLIDVRRKDEYHGELGHIQGSKLVTLESDFQNFINSIPSEQHDDSFVFICRSGARSARAALMAAEQGCTSVFNMAGGMIAWNQAGFETQS